MWLRRREISESTASCGLYWNFTENLGIVGRKFSFVRDCSGVLFVLDTAVPWCFSALVARIGCLDLSPPLSMVVNCVGLASAALIKRSISNEEKILTSLKTVVHRSEENLVLPKLERDRDR